MSDDELPNIVKDVVLTNVADIPASERSSISLHLLVKNGASVVGRLMDNVGPYLTEVVAILNDCEDETESVLAEKCNLFNLTFVPIHVTRETHPQFYILDEEATYKIGMPLAEEQFGGPFTNQPILADWSAVRNLGWSRCTSKWKLFLDADDIVLDPECLPGLVKELEKHGVELAVANYTYGVDPQGRPFASSLRERLALTASRVRWGKPIHECLFGSNRISHVTGCFTVRDMRDNGGKDVRVPGRNFKILYHLARSKDWEISPRLMADLVQEVRHLAAAPGMMRFAESLVGKYMEEASWPEERGWVFAMIGEMREMTADFDGAIDAYNNSLSCHPGSKTAFRLCRATFGKACATKVFLEEKAKEGSPESVFDGPGMEPLLRDLWCAVVAAYSLGVENKKFHQALDDGPLYEDMEAIHAAGALMELGDAKGALTLAEKALAAFPESSPLKFMVSKIKEVT